jgi:hypothetical protein
LHEKSDVYTQTAPFRLLAVFSPTYWDRAYRFKDEVLWDEIRRKQGNVSAFSGFMLGQCRFLKRAKTGVFDFKEN